jgi:CIC family chloride channel protein
MAPAIAPPATACVLVGMGGFFAGVAKVPIASLIMVAEMSGSYSLLVPMMLVASVAFLLTRGVGIYEAQVPGRIDSPAHIGEFQIDVLERLAVRDVIDPDQDVVMVAPGTPFGKVLEIVAAAEQHAFPVVNERGIVEGVFSVTDVRRVLASPEVWSVLVASDLAVSASSMAFLEPDDDLHTAVRRFTAFRHENLPVLSGPPPSDVVGLLEHHSVLEAYDSEIRRLQQEGE